MSRPLRLTGGQILRPDGFAVGDLAMADGVIGTSGSGGLSLDASGWLVLPGIIDLHGDAFERQLQPRPGVNFPADVALADTERQLLANGITTAFHGVTLSWEPGLRGLETWRALKAALFAQNWVCDMRLHLRWEAFNLDALPVALADIAAGRVGLLAFNDHTPEILPRLENPAKAAIYAERAGVSVEALRDIGTAAAARQAEVAGALAALAAAARSAGIPMASHDDDTLAGRDAFRGLGARISEFPMTAEIAHAARAAGDAVVMGSPNVVRGGSHMGWISAGEMAEAGVCSVLTSDYFYPCLTLAPFVLERRGRMDLAAAWPLVSTNAARAAGLADRGMLAEGMRGDVVVVDRNGSAPRVMVTICAGRIGYLAADAADRLG